MIIHESYAIANVPIVRDFIRKVDERLARSDPTSFWPAVSGFERIIDMSVWDQVYACAVDRIATDPSYNGGKDWGVHGFLLAESESFHFSMRSSRRPEFGRNVVDRDMSQGTSIVSIAAAPSVMFVATRDPVEFNVYAMPSSANLDEFDPDVAIENRGTRQYEPWSRIDMDAPAETLEICRESAISCFIVELAMKPVYAQRWEFNRDTGVPIGAVMLSRESVVIKAMVEEIERFRYAKAIDQVADLINHPDFNVRWASMKCAFAIDENVGRSMLELLCLDKNRYVRVTASNLIDSIDRG